MKQKLGFSHDDTEAEEEKVIAINDSVGLADETKVIGDGSEELELPNGFDVVVEKRIE